MSYECMIRSLKPLFRNLTRQRNKYVLCHIEMFLFISLTNGPFRTGDNAAHDHLSPLRLRSEVRRPYYGWKAGFHPTARHPYPKIVVCEFTSAPFEGQTSLQHHHCPRPVAAVARMKRQNLRLGSPLILGSGAKDRG